MRPARLGDRPRPVVGEDLDLAVAVELVAEEVAEDDQGRVELGRDPRQPGLVHLEQPLAAALLEQSRRDPPGHVRAGPVVDGLRPSASSRAAIIPAVVVLPLVALTNVDAAVEPRAQAGDRVGGEPQQHPARQRRAAAAPARPAGGADRPRHRLLGAEQPPRCARWRSTQPSAWGRGTITLRARGRTRSAAGRSVRCSPSA